MDRGDQRVMSFRLSRVMEDIGISRYIIAKRRGTWLEIEKLREINFRIKSGVKLMCYYHFGSQSEGNTTPGMESDIDLLMCLDAAPVILNWRDWKQGLTNLLVLKNELFPPQHCLLQCVRHDLPLPLTEVRSPNDVVDNEGRVLYTNTQIETHQRVREFNSEGVIVRHGPSKSWDKNIDIVAGFRCPSLPHECQFMFNRPRPGHWPRPHTLERAKESGVFLVPQGYTESPSRPSRCRSTALHITDDPSYPESRRQWRFSTAIMERLLMFDMNIQQHKTFVFLKILRKQFFKPIVGDRLSTFHMKTTMLFTIETYPSEIWREDNLVQCVIYCLTTLLRCVKIKYCPHYTISEVNLFTGKLFKHEQTLIRNMILKMISDNMSCVFSIQIDDIGRKMSSQENCVSLQSIKTRCTNISLINTFLFKNNVGRPNHLNETILNESDDNVDYVLLLIHHIAMLTRIYDQGTSIEQEAVLLLKPKLCGTLASIKTSRKISQSQPVTPAIFKMYKMSFDSDLLSSRLKFASMLYCSGQYEAARNCLNYCEGLLGPEVWQSCSCKGRRQEYPSREFKEKASYKSNKEMMKYHYASCVSFSRHEICCVPLFLLYEMFRMVGDEDRQQRRPASLYKWMDYIVIDCVPFLYYLQYLTYRQLNMPLRQQAARDHLKHYVFFESKGHGHIDTAFNMLGHCCELENRLDRAWICYTESLLLYSRNNAAKWHIARLLNRGV
ncbi:uncharacterized protein LOC128217333 [Mya arenaria]|uniref:uncharacterized protein LOC128217333 n=1 Tax=Mya arenaria TaxID=6604 RepID=UPI0022E72AC9|nr:uncharacterized protein LOC128217333 [Mya arenaria]